MTLNLDEIRQRAERATAGRKGSWRTAAQNKAIIICDGGGEIARASEKFMDRAQREANADFIAHARTDVPALCDEVERLKAEVAHWKANHDEMKARNDVLRDRLDLDAEKVKPRLTLLDRYDALKAENAKLREVISHFVKKYDECDPYITSAFSLAYTNRGGQYTGPTFKDELGALRALANGGAGGG